MKRQAGPEIEKLIQLLARLPGLGPRSARRAVLHLIKNREKLLTPLTRALEDAQDKVTVRDLQATILNQLGFDPHRFSYSYLGLNQRLIGPTNEARVVREILS